MKAGTIEFHILAAGATRPKAGNMQVDASWWRQVCENPRHRHLRPVVLATERELEGRGRVVLRYSGTESLARVMVEADDDALVRSTANRIADVIREHLGG